MAENGNGTNGKSWWLTVIQQVAFPIIACCVVTWFAYQTIQWERDQMLPALRDNTAAINSNSDVLREVKSAIQHAERNP